MRNPFGNSMLRGGYDISLCGEQFLFSELTREEEAWGPLKGISSPRIGSRN
jgi:hypothetical protein